MTEPASCQVHFSNTFIRTGVALVFVHAILAIEVYVPLQPVLSVCLILALGARVLFSRIKSRREPEIIHIRRYEKDDVVYKQIESRYPVL